MRSKHQDLRSEVHWSRGEIRTAIWFWFFWSAYAVLSAILIAALLTDWPHFLHEQTYLR
jgi:hypothetical protein